MKKIFTAIRFLALVMWVIPQNLVAQVSCIPIFPAPTDSVTVTFNVNEGSRGLVGETGDIYAHTGVVTNQSNNGWRYVRFPWGTNDPSCLLTPLGNGLYQLRIPNIRTWYNVPAGEEVLKLAFVFRNAGGTREGKTVGGSDIFYEVYPTGSALAVRLLQPTTTSQIVDSGRVINLDFVASKPSNITITDNGATLTTINATQRAIYAISATQIGFHRVVCKAVAELNQTDSSVFTYTIARPTQTAAVPSGAKLGANFNALGDSVTFVLDAPRKNNVFVIGSFNNYETNPEYQMKRSADSTRWWLKVKVTPNTIYTYQYLVDGTIKVADPLSTLVLDPSNDGRIPAATYPNLPAYPTGKTEGIASVIHPGKPAYNWRVQNFVRPLKSDLVIYELLVRDFVAKHDFQTLIDTIGYLKKLGVNAIQLMPVNEYDNNESWGYNPNFHNAIDKYYGTTDKFKEFVDVCHLNGIAVIADIVFNHAWGLSPLARLYLDGSAPSLDNPWLNREATHPYNVGFDMNHESKYTKDYVDRSLQYWLQEYRIDGYRFDLSKGFTQNRNTDVGAWGRRDASRIAILKHYHNTVQQTSPGAYDIMEHFADNSEETELANDGMMLWGNMSNNYAEAAMGYSSNALGGVSARSRAWNTTTNANALVGYMESHDEERMLFKTLSFGNFTGDYNTKDPATALKRKELTSAFFYTVPGPKMLWQFGELGYDVSIDFNGRTGNKPIRWNYLTEPNRLRLHNVTRNLIHLKTQNPAFRSLNYNEADLNSGAFKHFHVSDASMNVTVIGNFSVTAFDVVPYFQTTGKWYNYLTGDSINVTSTTTPIFMLPGEYRVYTSVRLPRPPAGYITFPTSNREFAEKVDAFEVYPNPSVSSETFLGFSIKKAANVSWEVLNAVGQVVAREKFQFFAAGSHQVQLNTDLPQGNYFVKLNVDGSFATQKLVIVK
jgi:1,4-alpha-glucan branching enzyme